MFCVLADLVSSLLPFSTVPATVMLALPVLHRSAQYHKLSCFSQPSPFVLSYYALSWPVLSVPNKLTLTPTFCLSPPIPSTYLSCPYHAALSFNGHMAFLFPAPLRTFIAALPCPTCQPLWSAPLLLWSGLLWIRIVLMRIRIQRKKLLRIRIRIQIRGGGVGQPKMCIPPGKILGTPLVTGIRKYEKKKSVLQIRDPVLFWTSGSGMEKSRSEIWDKHPEPYRYFWELVRCSTFICVKETLILCQFSAAKPHSGSSAFLGSGIEKSGFRIKITIIKIAKNTPTGSTLSNRKMTHPAWALYPHPHPGRICRRSARRAPPRSCQSPQSRPGAACSPAAATPGPPRWWAAASLRNFCSYRIIVVTE